MKIPATLMGIVVALFLSGTAFSQEVIEGCYPALPEDVAKFDPPKFKDYPVGEVFKGKPAPVRLEEGHWMISNVFKANQFEDGHWQVTPDGPDFAGRYTIVKWGCGSACIRLSIADVPTGAIVYEMPATVGLVGEAGLFGKDAERVLYHKDSKLLVITGETEDGNESTAGIHYYLWKNNHLELIKFIQDKKHYCGPKKQRKTP